MELGMGSIDKANLKRKYRDHPYGSIHHKKESSPDRVMLVHQRSTQRMDDLGSDDDNPMGPLSSYHALPRSFMGLLLDDSEDPEDHIDPAIREDVTIKSEVTALPTGCMDDFMRFTSETSMSSDPAEDMDHRDHRDHRDHSNVPEASIANVGSDRKPYREPIYEHGNLKIHALIDLAKNLDQQKGSDKTDTSFFQFADNKNDTAGQPPVTYTHDEVVAITQVCIRLLDVKSLEDMQDDEIRFVAMTLRAWCKARNIDSVDNIVTYMSFSMESNREGYSRFFVNIAYAVAATFLDRSVAEYCGKERKIPSNMTYQQVYAKSKCSQQWGRQLYTIETRNLVERTYLYVAMFMGYMALSPSERATRFTCLTERTTHHRGYVILSIDMDGKSDWHKGQDEQTILMHWSRCIAIVDEIVKEFFEYQFGPDGHPYDGTPQTYKELNEDGSIPITLQRDYYIRDPSLPKHAVLRRIMARREPFKWHIHYPNIIINMATGRAIVGLINKRLKMDPFFGQFKQKLADESLYNLSGLRMLGMNKGRMEKKHNPHKIPLDWPAEKKMRLDELQKENAKATWIDVEEEMMDPLMRAYRDDPSMAIYLPVDEQTLERRDMTFDDFYSCSILAPEHMPMSKQIKSLMQYAVLTTAGVEKVRDNIVDASEEYHQMTREKQEKESIAEEMRRRRLDGDGTHQNNSSADGYLLNTHDDTVYQSVKVVLDFIRKYDSSVRETVKVYTKPARINIASASRDHLDRKHPYSHRSQHTYWQLSMAGLTQRCHDTAQCSKYCYTVVKFKDLPEEVTTFMAEFNIFERPRGFEGTPGITVVKFALMDLYEQLMMEPEDLDDCSLEFTDEGCEIIFPNSQQRLIFALPKFNKELTDWTRNVPYVYWKNHGEHAMRLHGNMAGALVMLGARRHWVGTELESHFERTQTLLPSKSKNLERTKAKIAQPDEQTRMSMYAQLEEIPEHAMFYDKWLNALSRDLCTGRPSAVADLVYYVAFADFAYEDRKWWCIHNGRWFSGDIAKSFLINVQYNYQVCGFMHATMWYYKTQVEYPSPDVKKKVMNGLARSANILSSLTDTKDCYKMICQRFEAGGNLYCQSFVEGETMVSKMDTNKEYMCFENCVWNHKTDWVGPPSPSMHLHFYAPIQFPLVETPDILEQERFVYGALRPIMQSDEMFDFLMMSMSTMFLGENNPATMYLWVGRGSNGKSVLENLLQDVFGEYVQDVAPTMFTRAGGNVDSPSPVMVSMKGRRFIIMSEPESNALQSALIKRMTGGTEVQGRPLFSNQIVKFVPMAQVCVQCNELPYVDKFDGGIARRVVVVPFVNQFKQEGDYHAWNPRHRKADPRILEKLKANRQGFLLLLVKYYRRLRDQYNYKLPRPREVQEATENWLCSNDIVYDFKTRYCRPDKGTTRTYGVKELHVLITQYFNDTYGGKHPVIKVPSLTQLGERLWSCGYDLEEIDGQRSPVTRYRVVNTYIRSEDEIKEGENVTATALDEPYGRGMVDPEEVPTLEQVMDQDPYMDQGQEEAKEEGDKQVSLVSCFTVADLPSSSVLGLNPKFPGKNFPGTCIHQTKDDYMGAVFMGCETRAQATRRTEISKKCGFDYKHPANIWQTH